MTKRKKRRALAASLAVEAGGCISDMPQLFAACIFFENWIELGGDETQKRMKLLPEQGASLHAINGGATERR